MRTTITLDDDVLSAARQLARKHDSTLGQALSDIARRGLQPRATVQIRNGVPLLPIRRRHPGAVRLPIRRRGKKTTMDLVNRLRDEE